MGGGENPGPGRGQRRRGSESALVGGVGLRLRPDSVPDSRRHRNRRAAERRRCQPGRDPGHDVGRRRSLAGARRAGRQHPPVRHPGREGHEYRPVPCRGQRRADGSGGGVERRGVRVVSQPGPGRQSDRCRPVADQQRRPGLDNQHAFGRRVWNFSQPGPGRQSDRCRPVADQQRRPGLDNQHAFGRRV